MKPWGAAAAATLALCVPTVGCVDRPAQEPEAVVHSPRDPAEGRTEFALERVSITRGGDGEERASLSAERIVCRKRTGLGGFVTYQDAREILLTGAELSIRSSSERTPLFQTLAKGILPSLPPDGLLAALVRGRGSITRLVFDEPSLRVEGPGGDVLSIASKRARFDPATETLVLEDGFELSLRDGWTLRGVLGVLSGRRDGIYLPLGHALGPDRVDHTAFLVPDGAGGLVPAAVVPLVAYRDDLEAAERAMVSHFLERVPGGLKSLLFATLAQARPVGDQASPGP